MPARGRWDLPRVLKVGFPDVHLPWARMTVTCVAKTANFDSRVSWASEACGLAMLGDGPADRGTPHVAVRSSRCSRS